MKYSFGVCALLVMLSFLFSCQKEIPETPFPDTDLSEECFIAEFPQFEQRFVYKIHGYAPCGGAEAFQSVYFRMLEGYQEGSAYYYYIQTRQHYSDLHMLDSCTARWEDKGLYRYDFEQQTATVFTGPALSDSHVVFDFSKQVGDTILLDSSRNVRFVIDQKSTRLLSGVLLPIVSGRIVGIDKQVSHPLHFGSMGQQSIEITPYTPNPVYFYQDFAAYPYLVPELDPIFHNAPNYTDMRLLDEISLEVKNVDTDDWFSKYVISGFLP